MTHQMTRLILQLAVIVISSKIMGQIFERYLKQPRVLGELTTGIIIGPYMLGQFFLPLLNGPLFPIPVGSAIPISPELYGFAVVASIILLFLAGLETDLSTFLKFAVAGTAVGMGGVVLSFFIGATLTWLFVPGVPSLFHPTALFMGTLATATSVGITARILSEKKKMSSPEGVTILAGAVLDDVVGIVILAVVVGIVKVGQAGGSLQWGRIAIIASKAFGFWLICTVVGIIIAPRISRSLKWFKKADTIAGMSLGLALVLAGLSETAGLAMIIGAYITGLSLSRTDIASMIEEKLTGIYDFFVPIFFCVMGMMVNFKAMQGVVGFGLIYTLGAVVGKIFGCGVPALFMGFNLRGAFRIGAGMLPRGEVTLIVAGVGLSSGAIGQNLFGVAIMTLLIASIVAPPTLVASFSGGDGLRKKMSEKTEELTTFSLDLKNEAMVEFMASRVQHAFVSEEFFVHRLHSLGSTTIYRIRKEDIFITMEIRGNTLEFATTPANRQLVRLMVFEEILVMKDLLSSLDQIQSSEKMGTELLSGLFSGIRP
ncbi:cation:proton antiporter [Myxococcota bacterium]|nr:cation:proton antiporter [Myxococcota bacterium]MBU1535054.1 cation:proton antiporter [Myxococcota bacterium]